MTRTALLLDVDGTLVDIAPTPTDVVVPSALLRVLAELTERAGGAVALVSGRTIETIDRLFSPLVTPAIGEQSGTSTVSQKTLKKLIKKEVSKQIGKATGPQGSPGTNGTNGANGTASPSRL